MNEITPTCARSRVWLAVFISSVLAGCGSGDDAPAVARASSTQATGDTDAPRTPVVTAAGERSADVAQNYWVFLDGTGCIARAISPEEALSSCLYRAHDREGLADLLARPTTAVTVGTVGSVSVVQAHSEGRWGIWTTTRSVVDEQSVSRVIGVGGGGR